MSNGRLIDPAGAPEELKVCYQRVGGILRFSGTAVVRHPLGDLRQPVTIVIRQEHATNLDPAIIGRLQTMMEGSIGSALPNQQGSRRSRCAGQ